MKQNHVAEFFESRSRAEDEAALARTPRNRLHVSSLVALLEERQNMVGGGGGAVEERELAEKYGLDGERLERLVRSVNVPGVLESSGGGGGAAGAGGGVRYVGDAEGGEDIPVTEVSFVCS